MSGTLRIRDDVTWMPTGWIFDGVLQAVADELTTDDTALAAALVEAQTSVRAYGDLRSLHAERLCMLLAAAERAYTRIAETESDLFHNPTSYVPFLYIFSELKALLRTDPRIERGTEMEGNVVVSDSAIWTAPGWVFDMVLEHLAAGLRPVDERLASSVLNARVTADGGECDLRALDSRRFQLLLSPTEWMYSRYGDGRGYDSYAPAFFAELAPFVVGFATLLRADARTGNRNR